MSRLEEPEAGVLNALWLEQGDRPTLRFVTCGSVDDGKSTLVGRLLYDSEMLPDDQLTALRSESKVVGTSGGDLDFALLKDFKYRDRLTLRFSLIMANALNHPNFSPPAANISSPGTVGVISSQTRPLLGEPAPREIDFALRLIF